MADYVVSDDSEKCLYLIQIQYLEEQLERCQVKCDELEEQNKDLLSQCSALEKDKKDITDYLKRSLAAKEKKVDELAKNLESQQMSAKHDREALNLQHSQQKQKLLDQINNLNSQSVTQAAKIEDQKDQFIRMTQQLQYVESLEKQLVSQKEEHKAAIDNLQMETTLERAKVIEYMQNTVNDSVKMKISEILQNERAQHSKREGQIQFLHRETTRLQEEKEALRDGERDLCIKKKMLKKDLKKTEQESMAYKEDVEQLSDNCKQLKVELKDCRITQQHIVAHIEVLRQRLDLVVKECREKAGEVDQLVAEIQMERNRQRQLERVMQEAAIILRHILTDLDKVYETQWKVQRLLEILESKAPQGTPTDLQP